MKFTVTVAHKYEFHEGYGVAFLPVRAGEDSPTPDAIVDVDASIVRICAEAVQIVGNVPCVALPDVSPTTYIPIESFLICKPGVPRAICPDDIHDLRNRWFATEEEARQHMEYTLRRWKHPQPWERFVRT